MATGVGLVGNEGNELCMFYMCIIILLSLVFFKTVAIFSGTYTLQQLGRSPQKNKNLVTLCLARSNFAPIHLPRRNTPAYGTHHLCVAILTTRYILTGNERRDNETERVDRNGGWRREQFIWATWCLPFVWLALQF
jgi:hypothetical protein